MNFHILRYQVVNGHKIGGLFDIYEGGNIMSSSLLNYRFGFAIYKNSSKPNLEEIKDWKHISVEEYEVHTHPEVDVQTIETRHGSAVLIGDAFICRGRKEVKDILELMLKKDAWDEFDNITGRFALLVVNKKEAKILHDPFGSRSVYYLQDGEVGISSHTPLLASLFGEKISSEAKAFMKLPEYKMRGTGYLPGDVTMYSNIKGLIPNNYYDLNKRKTYRFWPRHSMKPISVRAFLKECDRYLARFTSYYASRHNLLLGLTGGVDARALIAGMIANGAKPRLVTWTGNRLPAKEAPIVEEMKEHLGMAHVYMDPRAKVDTEKFKELSKAADPATGYSRGASGLTGIWGKSF